MCGCVVKLLLLSAAAPARYSHERSCRKSGPGGPIYTSCHSQVCAVTEACKWGLGQV